MKYHVQYMLMYIHVRDSYKMAKREEGDYNRGKFCQTFPANECTSVGSLKEHNGRSLRPIALMKLAKFVWLFSIGTLLFPLEMINVHNNSRHATMKYQARREGGI